MSNERIEAIRSHADNGFSSDSIFDDINTLLDHIDKLEAERMPTELTAENGADLLLGDKVYTRQIIKVTDYNGNEEDELDMLFVSFDAIKQIYKMIYDNREALNK